MKTNIKYFKEGDIVKGNALASRNYHVTRGGTILKVVRVYNGDESIAGLRFEDANESSFLFDAVLIKAENKQYDTIGRVYNGLHSNHFDLYKNKVEKKYFNI